jgi:signal transduction histidine kinase
MAHYALLMSMLAGVFVMVGLQYVAIFARNSDAAEHFWFGAAALAAAGSAIAYSPVFGEAISGAFVAHLPRLFSATWLVTSTWFVVEYSFGDSRHRWTALLATLLTVIAYVGGIGLTGTERPPDPASATGPWHLAGLAALLVIFALAVEGTWRLWSTSRRVRAAALIVFCFAIPAVGWSEVLERTGFPVLSISVLCAFLFVVLVTTYELAGAVVDGEGFARRQQQELAIASRLSIVGELTASLAHEINQPLGAILSNADAAELLLADPNPPLDEIRQILVDIRRDGLRASDVIRHVRKLVRQRELEFEKLDANAVAIEVIELLGAEARNRRIPIAPSLWPQPAYVYGDRALIGQMLINLLTNAMDSIDSVIAEGGTPPAAVPVVLGVSSTSHGEIEFQVVDSGAGIPIERLEHLFDSFYTSKAHGMGLGLSIARSIVEAHGGRIRAENNREGGATFRATFPPFEEAGVSQVA